MAATDCSVDGCVKPAKTRGWCGAHYERWRRNGEPGPAGDGRKRPVMKCSIEGCDRVAKARGWCYKHWACWRATGDPIARVRPTYGQRLPALSDAGYLRVWAPDHPLAHSDGTVLEHRKVAWDHGILTDPRLHVHHINHDRTDNRPENLEALAQSDHSAHHVEERGEVTNQYGTWPLHRLRAAS